MRRIIRRLSSICANQRFYWRFLAVFQRARFYAGKRGFGVKSSVHNISSEFNIFLALTKATIPMLLLATLCVGGMLGLNLLGAKLATVYHLPSGIASLFEVIKGTNQTAYDGFLIAIVTVTGVFLTLYFTGLSTVAGTIYANKPERIRVLLIQEKVGDVYTRFLIFLTIVSITLLVIGAVGDFRPKTTIFFIGFLGFISIRAFVVLGKHAFGFFDPTVFADRLLVDLGRWSYQATIEGYRWDDPSFQNHYRQRAHEAIKGVRTLVEVSHEETYLKQESLTVLLSKLLLFLSIYLKRKRHIPSNSFWYRFTPLYKEWYLSPYYSVGLATQTQTGIQPEMKPEPHWVEEEILGLQIESLENCLKDGRTGVAFHILGDMISLFETLGAEWEVEYGGKLLSKMTSQIDYFLIQSENANIAETGESKQVIEMLGVLDYLGILPISLLLGFVKELEGVDIEAISTTLARINWGRAKEIYDLGMPNPVLEQLEFVQQRLEFEIKAEGRVVSPDWYLRQLVFQPIAYSIRRQLDDLMEVLSSFYLYQVKHLLGKGQYLLAAGLISCGLEFCSKALTHLPKAQKIATSLETLRVLPTLPWPEWNWQDTRKEFSDAQDLLIVYLVQCIPGLATIRRTEDIPDYFGRAVHNAGEWCFRALVANNLDLFSKIFPNYFLGALNIQDMLQEKTAEWRPEDAVPVFSEPLIDLCSLSGYAYLLAELHGEPGLWENCKAIWERFFQNVDRIQAMQLLASTIAYHRRLPFITHRSILRTQWQMQIDHLFRAMPRQQKLVTYPQGVSFVIPHYTEIVDHPSLLVRMMGGTDSDHFTSMYDGLDIFVSLYLKEKPEVQSLDFGRHDSLLDALERWRRNEERDRASQTDSGEVGIEE